MSRKFDKGRLTSFVPLLHSTLDTSAWRALSHGARSIYVALKRRVPKGRNQAYLSHRDAVREVGSKNRIGEWFSELEHYGFTVKIRHGSLGFEGNGKATIWRLTELGQTSKTSGGVFEPPTNEYLKWDRTLFVRKRRERKKQNPVHHGEDGVSTTGRTVLSTTGGQVNTKVSTTGRTYSEQILSTTGRT